MEESKLELEKAKQATMNEKNKRKEAESQVEAAGEEVNGLQQVAEAKMKRVQTEEQVKTAEAQRQAEEERAKQAAAVRMTAEEKLKTMKLQSGEKVELDQRRIGGSHVAYMWLTQKPYQPNVKWQTSRGQQDRSRKSKTSH